MSHCSFPADDRSSDIRTSGGGRVAEAWTRHKPVVDFCLRFNNEIDVVWSGFLAAR
jgi:hypothetical protein